MPKRGGKSRNWRANDHFEHDDRIHTNNTRRVSFKAGTNKGKNKFRNWDNSELMLNMDVGQNGEVYKHGSFKPRGGRVGSPAPRTTKRKFMPGLLPWYQIVVPYGAKHDKDVLLRAILGHIAPEVFIPHYFKVNGNAVIFYVDDVKIAEKLYYADRKIFMSDGFKLVLIVKNSIPTIKVDATVKEKMKLAMVKRYNAATKALDLTKFHADPEVSDIFVALFRPVVMLTAIDIIAENIPDLEALNLNDNKLHGIEHLNVLCTKLKNLKILYMGDNRIPYLGSLDPLKPLQLVELYLKGNPLVNRFSDHEIYVSDVRKKFPKLVRLDGVDLPPTIGFDVADNVVLPPRQQSFLVDPSGQDLVREFLTQYFAIYDSESRQQLLDAYHESAMMSMAANYLTNDNRNVPTNRLNAYISNSRNIMRVTEREFRKRYLKSGKLHIVSFLSDLPKTKHDLMGFAVDLLVYTPALIVLTMNGVYKETHVNGNPNRSFHRTFVIVPNSSGGFSIINDIMFITNTTKAQDDRAFSAGAEVAAAASGPASVAAPAVGLPVHDDTQRAMLATLAQQTGMNEHWTINCLQETGWDFQRALFIFNQLNSEGKIPPEAFVK